MKENGTLQVLYDGKVVGNLALMAGRKIAFEYSEEWLETGFSISPFSLPLKEQVFIPTKEYFSGLFGIESYVAEKRNEARRNDNAESFGDCGTVWNGSIDVSAGGTFFF